MMVEAPAKATHKPALVSASADTLLQRCMAADGVVIRRVGENSHEESETVHTRLSGSVVAIGFGGVRGRD